jgi:O-6-methylguanine DNA methyltransferase
MKSPAPDATESRSCRLGPHWVTVECRGGKVTGVTLGKKGPRDDRKLAKDLDRVLQGGMIPEHLHVDTTGIHGFPRKVLGRCAGIPPGQVMTYSQLARAAGSPRGERAAGQVMANNPFALLIPCHRVVGSDYTLHGFGGGLEMKEWLLAREGWQFIGKGKSRKLAARLPQARKSRG